MFEMDVKQGRQETPHAYCNCLWKAYFKSQNKPQIEEDLFQSPIPSPSCGHPQLGLSVGRASFQCQPQVTMKDGDLVHLTATTRFQPRNNPATKPNQLVGKPMLLQEAEAKTSTEHLVDPQRLLTSSCSHRIIKFPTCNMK